jgi:hypothetical protein
MLFSNLFSCSTSSILAYSLQLLSRQQLLHRHHHRNRNRNRNRNRSQLLRRYHKPFLDIRRHMFQHRRSLRSSIRLLQYRNRRHPK